MADISSFDNYQLIDELRKRGLAVVAFSYEDIISAHCPDDIEDPSDALMDEAQAWLNAHRDYLECQIAEHGNGIIGWATDPIGQPVSGE